MLDAQQQAASTELMNRAHERYCMIGVFRTLGQWRHRLMHCSWRQWRLNIRPTIRVAAGHLARIARYIDHNFKRQDKQRGMTQWKTVLAWSQYCSEVDRSLKLQLTKAMTRSLTRVSCCHNQARKRAAIRRWYSTTSNLQAVTFCVKILTCSRSI